MDLLRARPLGAHGCFVGWRLSAICGLLASGFTPDRLETFILGTHTPASTTPYLSLSRALSRLVPSPVKSCVFFSLHHHHHLFLLSASCFAPLQSINTSPAPGLPNHPPFAFSYCCRVNNTAATPCLVYRLLTTCQAPPRIPPTQSTRPRCHNGRVHIQGHGQDLRIKGDAAVDAGP